MKFRRHLSIASVGLLLCGHAVLSRAAESDAATQARTIARFMPQDTVAVGHIDVTQIKTEPLFAELRRIAPDSGPQLEHVETATEQSVDQFLKAGGREAFVVLTMRPPVVVVPLPAGADEAGILAVLARAPFETTEKIGGALVAGPEAVVAELHKAQSARAELARALAAAGNGPLSLVLLPTEDNRKVIEQLMPKLPGEFGGGSTKPISRGLSWAAVGINLPPKLAMHVVLQATDADTAGQIRSLWDGVAESAAKLPEAKKELPNLAQLRKLLTPEVSKDQLVLDVDGKQLIEELHGPIERARGNAKRMQSINNLKQLALSMHIYHDVNKSFPPAVHAKDGKPLLSWRVLVLPYLEQDALYKKFHLDEPWDSEHNKPLIAEMPVLFRSPLSAVANQGRTVYLTPRGKETAFPGQKGVRIAEITDGTSNTIMIVEADDEHAVVWTKPDDWEYDPKQPLRGLRDAGSAGFLAAFCDGSVRGLPDIKPERLRAMLTMAGGEVISND